MTAAHCYHDLPTSIRPRHLESHTGWPRTWAAPTQAAAIEAHHAIVDIIARGHMAGMYDVHVLSTDRRCEVVVTRVGDGE